MGTDDKSLSEEIISLICIEKAKGIPNDRNARNLKLSDTQVRSCVADEKELVKELKGQLREHRTNLYEKLFKKSIKALEDILTTAHIVNVFDKQGNCTGHTTDGNIIKMKKEVAHELLESLNVKRSFKGGGININQNVAQITQKDEKVQKVIEMDKNEIRQILDDCRIEPKDIKKIAASLN